jgi:hypothetical protein
VRKAINILLAIQHYGAQMKVDEMGATCSRHEEVGNAYKIVTGDMLVRRALGIRMHGWVYKNLERKWTGYGAV